MCITVNLAMQYGWGRTFNIHVKFGTKSFLDRHFWDQKPQWFEVSELVSVMNMWLWPTTNDILDAMDNPSYFHHSHDLYENISTMYIPTGFTRNEVSKIRVGNNDCGCVVGYR
jgi:hypothetical protein